MIKGLGLKELAEKIESQHQHKLDMVADTRQLEMVRVGDAGGQMLDTPEGRFTVRGVAHNQIATHTGIPRQYYDTMQKDAPQLLATNVNEWFRLNPARRMVRAMQTGAASPGVRAFLSDRYQRIEHEEIAETVLPVLLDVPGIQVVSSEVTERKLYIHAVTSRIQREVKVGDVVEAGVVIQNSEVGLGSVSVQPLVWRLICLNGMKVPDGGFKRHHVGRRVAEDEQLDQVWADDTRRSDDRTVQLKVRDTVRLALDEVRFGKRVEQMRQLADGSAKVTGDPVKAIEVLSKRHGISEGERPSILRSLIDGGDLSAWGVLNAVTAQAHGSAYDRAVEFEAMGGELLAMPASEWRPILEAA